MIKYTRSSLGSLFVAKLWGHDYTLDTSQSLSAPVTLSIKARCIMAIAVDRTTIDEVITVAISSVAQNQFTVIPARAGTISYLCLCV